MYVCKRLYGETMHSLYMELLYEKWIKIASETCKYNIYVYCIYEFNEHYAARANNFSYAGIKSYGTNGSDAAGIRWKFMCVCGVNKN